MSAAESPAELLERLAADREAPARSQVGVKLAITGGRDHTPTPAEIQALLRLIDELPAEEVHHGDCRGADRLAAAAVKRHRPNVKVIPHPADWNGLGYSAGPIRNRYMMTLVRALAHFPGDKGTRNCIGEARRQGRQLYDLEALGEKLLLEIQADHL